MFCNMVFALTTPLNLTFYLLNPTFASQKTAFKSVITPVFRIVLHLSTYTLSECPMYAPSSMILLRILELTTPSSVFSQHSFPTFILTLIIIFYNYLCDHLSPSSSISKARMTMIWVIFVAPGNSLAPETWYITTAICWMNDDHKNKFSFRRYCSS